MGKKIKKLISLIIVMGLVLNSLTSCASEDKSKKNTTAVATNDNIVSSPNDSSEEGDPTPYKYEPNFASMNDSALWSYIEDDTYLEIAEQLGSEDYFVESVTTKYISQEYIDEMEYNSKANVFFGYTLEELDNQFEGKRYVFTLGDDGETVVKEFEAYDDYYERMIRNVAIGTGVILVCVVVSTLTAGVGTGAVSIIFAEAADSATKLALSSALIGGAASTAITGITTGDMDKALKDGLMEATEGYKWGAIIGAVAGGASGLNKVSKLKKADLKVSLKDAAKIQKETGYPPEVIEQFHNMEEYEVFKQAGLKAKMVNGKLSLIRDIDLKKVDNMGRTNLQRMKEGLSAIDADGKYFELHHIGQEADGTLAILSQAEHDSKALHGFKTVSEIDRPEFASVRKKFWKDLANVLEGAK